MSASLASDTTKDIVIYVNDFYPELPGALNKLSDILGRPLRGIMLVDAERKASGKYKPIKDGIFEEVVVDFSSDAELAKALKPLQDRLLLITCSSEQSQLYFKRVIPHVPYISTPTESSLDFCTDKGKMRELLNAYDPAISPKAIIVYDSSPDSVKKASELLEFPLIVKPSNLAASKLVNKASNAVDLEKILQESFISLDKIYSQYRGLGNKTMVVEEFVQGDLYSTDVYVDAEGEVYVLPFVYFVNGAMVGMEGYQVYQAETYHTLSDQDFQKGVDAAKKAVHAVGLRSSVAHVELFHTINGWKIIELGARSGGWRQEMYEVSYGINHACNELLIKIGLEPDMPTNLKTYCSSYRIHSPMKGIAESIVGVEEARIHPDMHTLNVNIREGDKVLPAHQGGGVLIEGLMHHTDHQHLDDAVARVRATIKVTIKPDEEE